MQQQVALYQFKMEEIESAIIKLKNELRELYREKTRLDNQSYSQSNPGAVMERRWVRREIEKKERTLIELYEGVKSKTQ
jgi:hypothetical protein